MIRLCGPGKADQVCILENRLDFAEEILFVSALSVNDMRLFRPARMFLWCFVINLNGREPAAF